MLVSLPVRDVAQIKKIDLVLNENGRLEELYKISSGTHITDATIEAVVSLVDNQG